MLFTGTSGPKYKYKYKLATAVKLLLIPSALGLVRFPRVQVLSKHQRWKKLVIFNITNVLYIFATMNDEAT